MCRPMCDVALSEVVATIACMQVFGYQHGLSEAVLLAQCLRVQYSTCLLVFANLIIFTINEISL